MFVVAAEYIWDNDVDFVAKEDDMDEESSGNDTWSMQQATSSSSTVSSSATRKIGRQGGVKQLAVSAGEEDEMDEDFVTPREDAEGPFEQWPAAMNFEEASKYTRNPPLRVVTTRCWSDRLAVLTASKRGRKRMTIVSYGA